MARPRARALLAAALLTALALSGCAGGGGDSAGTAAAPDAPAALDGDTSAGGSAGARPAADTGVTGEVAASAVAVHLVRTAEIAVEVEDLATASARVRSTAEGLGGTVDSEVTGFTREVARTSEDGTGQVATPGESVLVLRVPEPSLDAAVDRVAGIGETQSRTTSSQDVTADLADLESRVKTATESLTRVRALVAQAEDLQDVVLLESELTKRQSDLEALQARRASLADRADLATLTVVLRTPAAQPAAEGDGFVAGLRSGWDSLVASAVVALRVVGALVPWAVLALLVAFPVRWLVRRARRPVPTPAPAAPPEPAQEPAGAGV